jgi:hypothetical protein
MDKKPRDAGTPTIPTGRQPGWFARRPAMTLISAPLRLRVSRSFHPLANRLASWSHSLAARWLPLHPVAKAWRGTLNLSVSHRPAAGNRRDFRQPTGVSVGKLFTQRRLHTLSLPEGFRIEEPSPEDWKEEAFSIEGSLAVEPHAASPDEELLQADVQAASFSEPNSPEQALPPANFQAGSAQPVTPGEESSLAGFEAPDYASSTPNLPHRGERFARPAQTGSTRPAANKISPPRWPFRLVSPFSEQKSPAARYASPGTLEFRKQRISQLRATSAALSSPLAASAPVLSTMGQAAPAGGETPRPHLMARPMVGEQLPLTSIPSGMVTLPFVGAGVPLILFGRPIQPVAGQANPAGAEEMPEGSVDQPARQPGARSAGARIVQGKTLPGIQPKFGAPALTAAQRALSDPARPDQSPSADTQAHIPPSNRVTQVQPPQAMLTLYPPLQPESDQPFQMSESQSYESRLEQEWPLLSVLHRLETRPEEPAEASGVQVLRRMWPEQSALVRQTLLALAAGGAGEGLPSTVLGPMQTRLGRDLSQVRLHTSALVQTLRAEAFTSGSNVVFAPGRLDLSTGKGLALLGHELTHIGQPLAFKQESSAGQVFEDSQERAARQQEVSIQNIVEHGWPRSHEMELQHPARLARFSMPSVTATSSFVQRLADEDTGSDQSTGSAASSAASAGESSAQAAGAASPGAGSSPSSGAGAGAAGGGPGANVDALARQVYGILKNRLRAERDRRELYNF